jgi:hypothetical protein
MDSLTRAIRRVHVLRLARLPRAPADAAAARAALAGVTRLEMDGRCVERVQLEAALRHLPGLRQVALRCHPLIYHPLDVEEISEGFVAALARCPSIESLEWKVCGYVSGLGAPGSRGGGRRALERAATRGAKGNARVAPRALGRCALVPWALCASTVFGRVHAACWLHLTGLGTATSNSLPPPRPPGALVPAPVLFGSLAVALPALTELRAASDRDADVSSLTGLRRLVLSPTIKLGGCTSSWDTECTAVEGLPELTALEDLGLNCSHHGRYDRLAPPSDLEPLAALTRLAMKAVPIDLGSSPVAARLRRLELQAFVVPEDAPGGGGGAAGVAAAALAALALGAPLLERLRILNSWPDLPGGGALGSPLGAGVEWPSLSHLQVPPWAAVLLAGCTFPRLSRLVARIEHKSYVPDDQLQAALAALAAKARDHVGLRVDFAEHREFDLAAAAAVPGLRHLSWTCGRDGSDAGAAPAGGDWARLAPSLESLELSAPLSACGEAALAALTGLTRLSVDITSSKAAGKPAPIACALARLPRLAHLQLSGGDYPGPFWGTPAVAAALAGCPALRLLEVGRRFDPLWKHEIGPARGANPCVPRPSAVWPPFAQALRAGGCRATVRPDPRPEGKFAADFDIEC